jgi:hypothetical protein
MNSEEQSAECDVLDYAIGKRVYAPHKTGSRSSAALFSPAYFPGCSVAECKDFYHHQP